MIDIPGDYFGVWYMDCMDDMQKYDGKTVKFLAQVCQTSRAGKDSFVPGRFAMTCCVQDIQFVGFPCRYDAYKALKQRDWITVTARVNIKFHPHLQGPDPRLHRAGAHRFERGARRKARQRRGHVQLIFLSCCPAAGKIPRCLF